MNNKTRDARAALVTGASYGVGQATALALARTGFDIAVTATRLENLERTVAELTSLGVKVVPLVLDLASQESIEAAAAEAVAAFGRLDVLVNNAGVHGRKPAVEITREDWDAMLEPNLAGTFFLTQQFGRHLIAAGRPGSIVNITSTHAPRGASVRLLYGVSKAAIHHMTKMLAIEWAPHGIRLNAVAPGRMLTASPTRQLTASDPGYIETMVKRIPLHRMVTAEEVAEAVAYLTSPAAASITGQVLVLDGGLTTQGS